MDLSKISAVSKGIAATVAGAIVAWLMKHNIVIADNLSDAVEVILAAIISGVVVYIAPPNKQN